MCRLRNIALRGYQESDYRTDRYTDRQTNAGQSDPYVPLCFAGDTKSVSMQQHFEQFVRKERRIEGMNLGISEAEPLKFDCGNQFSPQGQCKTQVSLICEF